MGRTASYTLTTKTARLKLKPRRKAYFVTLAPKLLLGYVRRSGNAAAGAWVQQREVGRNDAGQPIRRIRQIGLADDYAPADGVTVFSFEAARARAATADAPAPVLAITVKQAITLYIEHQDKLKGERAAADARFHLEGKRRGTDTPYIPVELANTPIALLTLSQLRAWQNGLVRRDKNDPDAERRSKDSANRIASALKAALNFIYADDAYAIQSNKAWSALEAFPKVARAREHHFSEAEAVTLIDKAREKDPYFADLLEAAFHSGARYGELIRLDVAHFNAARGELAIPGGKTGARVTLLSREGTAFFKSLAHEKQPGDVLLPRNKDGDRWTKSAQCRPMRRALKAAKLPAAACFYAMRHTAISRAIERNMPLSLVALNVGTSLRMIEKNYLKFLAQARRDLIDKHAPRLRVVR